MDEQSQTARITALNEQLRQERELDQRVAALLGWHSFTPGLHGGMLLGLKAGEPAAPGVTSRHEEVPWYSTEMGDAWLVVEHLHQTGDCLSLKWVYGDGETLEDLGKPEWKWVAEFRRAGVRVVACTAPKAICRAALKALSAS